jgi:tripartite-type tricarboxylate transporter receptor subunit TctC
MHLIKSRLARRSAFGVFALLASIGIFQNSASADDFYRTIPLTLVVGYVAGGYAVYARLLARHLPRHIPGAPTIIVQNMPGAGSLTALRHQEAIAPKDGSVVTLFDFFQIINSMFHPGKTNVEIRHLNWLGSMSENLSVR